MRKHKTNNLKLKKAENEKLKIQKYALKRKGLQHH
jgi:hypothetical protein